MPDNPVFPSVAGAGGFATAHQSPDNLIREDDWLLSIVVAFGGPGDEFSAEVRRLKEDITYQRELLRVRERRILELWNDLNAKLEIIDALRARISILEGRA